MSEQRETNKKDIQKNFTKMYCARRDTDEDSDLFRPCYKEKMKELKETATGELEMKPVPRELRPLPLQDSADETDLLLGFEQARETLKTERANIRNLNYEIENFGDFGMQPIAQWRRYLFTKEPTLSLVLGLNQIQILNGLNRLVKTVQNLPAGQHINEETGKWIYALLVCIHEPLLADNVSLLRQLARLSAEKLTQINIEDDNATTIASPYNLFITIVTQYFKQFDLKY